MFKYYIDRDRVDFDSIKACAQAYYDNEARHIRKLYDYYNGKHDILKKQVPEGRPNNQVVTNFCSEVTDNTIGFMRFGDATTQFDKAEIEFIMKDTLMTGVGYGLLQYIDSKLSITRVPATRALVIRDTTINHNPLAGVIINPYYYYEGGYRKQKFQLFIFDDANCYLYEGSTIMSAEFQDKWAHLIGFMPLLEAKSSLQYENLYEKAISIQDAFNTIDSSYADGRETFSQSFLLIKGMQVTDDTAETLINATTKIINLPSPQSDASYLIKDDSAADVKTMLDDLSDRFHKVVCVPDFNTEGDYGVASGKSNEFRAVAFYNLVNSRENIFKQYFLDQFDPTFQYAPLQSAEQVSDTVVIDIPEEQ